MSSVKRFFKYLIPLGLIAVAGWYWFFARAATIVLDNQPVMSVSALSISNYDASTGTSVAYRSNYFGGTWDGNLLAYRLGTSGAVSSVLWSASTQLGSQTFNTGWSSNRRVFTSVPSSSASDNTVGGVPFTWTGTTTTALSVTQQATLGGYPTGRYLVEYMRGNTATSIVSAYRTRFSKLGDIINSRPLYVKHSDSVQRVYVGSNDGMLHAFDANTGYEDFAYIPSMLLAKLPGYAASTYTHQYGVDGQLSFAAFTSSGTSYSILAAGMGAGGNGVFALNIQSFLSSDPSETSTDATKLALWEVTNSSTGFSNMGNVYGVPVQAKILNSDSSKTRVVLVPNGVNSSSGRASLFVINAINGSLLAEIVADATGPSNGLTGISVVNDNTGLVNYVYAGDLEGNIWKFDLTSTCSGSTCSYPSPTAVFSAPTDGTARPIMVAPSVSIHPAGGYMVNFGTGKVLETTDLSTSGPDYLYGVWDTTRSTSSTFAMPTLSTVVVSSTPYRVASAATNTTGTSRVWRITLPTGERVAGGPTLVDSGRFIVTTSVINSPTYGAWYNQVNALTGAGPTSAVVDVNGDGNLNKSDTVASGTGTVYPSGRYLGTGMWSQAVQVSVGDTAVVPFFNHNDNITISTVLKGTSTSSNPGVANGHFDVDLYQQTCTAAGSGKAGKGGSSTPTCDTHIHQYDDKYDVVGVDMLNASVATLNLDTGVGEIGTSTKFKILLANQKFSPALWLNINGVARKAYQVPLSPGGFVASTSGGSATVYSFDGSSGSTKLTSFVMAMPTYAFTSTYWVSGDIKRAGIFPTSTGCVHNNSGSNASAGSGATIGPWRSGAFTIQIVPSSATASSTTLSLDGDTSMGYVLNDDSDELAEYTLFWHASGKCYGESGWTVTPAQDNSAGSSSDPAPGSTDPTVFTWETTSGSDGTVYTGTGVNNGKLATQVITYDPINDQYIRKIVGTDGTVYQSDTFSGGLGGKITDIGSGGSGGAGGDPLTCTSSTCPSSSSLRLSWQELGR